MVVVVVVVVVLVVVVVVVVAVVVVVVAVVAVAAPAVAGVATAAAAIVFRVIVVAAEPRKTKSVAALHPKYLGKSPFGQNSTETPAGVPARTAHFRKQV